MGQSEKESRRACHKEQEDKSDVHLLLRWVTVKAMTFEGEIKKTYAPQG